MFGGHCWDYNCWGGMMFEGCNVGGHCWRVTEASETL